MRLCEKKLEGCWHFGAISIIVIIVLVSTIQSDTDLGNFLWRRGHPVSSAKVKGVAVAGVTLGY